MKQTNAHQLRALSVRFTTKNKKRALLLSKVVGRLHALELKKTHLDDWHVLIPHLVHLRELRLVEPYMSKMDCLFLGATLSTNNQLHALHVYFHSDEQ